MPKENCETQIHSSRIPANSDSISQNNYIFPRGCGAFL
jgi:hypothetical protein